jgi:hypothetical protein
MEKVTGFCAYCYRHERADLAAQMPAGGRALSRWLATHLNSDLELRLLYRAYAKEHDVPCRVGTGKASSC